MFKTNWISINFGWTYIYAMVEILKLQLACKTMISLRWINLLSDYFIYSLTELIASKSKYNYDLIIKKLKYLTLVTSPIYKIIKIIQSKFILILSVLKIVTFINHYRTGIIKQFRTVSKTFWSDICFSIFNFSVVERCLLYLEGTDIAGEFLPQNLSNKFSRAVVLLAYPIIYCPLTIKNNLVYYYLIHGNYGKA